MTDTTHTPGPWTVLSTDGHEGAFGIYAHAANAFIALTLDGPNEEANANLLKAAPAMRHVLQQLLDAFEEHQHGDLNDIPASEAIAMIQRAIIGYTK